MTDTLSQNDFCATPESIAQAKTMTDEQFLGLAVGSGALQDVLAPDVDALKRTQKDGVRKGEPFRLPCGCDTHGGRCPEEARLYAELEAARAVWMRSGRHPGEAAFPNVYRPVLRARADYAVHFDNPYDAKADGLWQDHCRLVRAGDGAIRATHRRAA